MPKTMLNADDCYPYTLSAYISHTFLTQFLIRPACQFYDGDRPGKGLADMQAALTCHWHDLITLDLMACFRAGQIVRPLVYILC